MQNALLRIASRQHLTVIKSLGNYLPELAKINPRMARAIVRIVMASSIHPRRDDDERRNDFPNEFGPQLHPVDRKLSNRFQCGRQFRTVFAPCQKWSHDRRKLPKP